jgi:hypothetical protein
MTNPSVAYLPVYENREYEAHVEKDKFTSDEKIKYKLRDVNLIKYNPNLFGVDGKFLEVFGGWKSLVITFGCGALAFYYRKNCNNLRMIKHREGTWFLTMYTLFGLGVGFTYSLAFLSRWQLFFNNQFAAEIMKRWKNSKELNKLNIYALKDIPNNDEVYVFTSTYANTYHM